MITSIEQHVVWIHDCLDLSARKAPGHHRSHVPRQRTTWVDHVNAVAELTLYPTCNSWYLGKNIPGKPQVFMPLIGFPPYVENATRWPPEVTRGSSSIARPSRGYAAAPLLARFPSRSAGSLHTPRRCLVSTASTPSACPSQTPSKSWMGRQSDVQLPPCPGWGAPGRWNTASERSMEATGSAPPSSTCRTVPFMMMA